MDQPQKPHVAILPSPGLGHLNPLVEFARRLVTDHDFTVTFVVPTDVPPSQAEKSILYSLPPESVEHIFLPPVNMDDLPKDSKFVTFLTLAVTRSLPALRDIFRTLVSRRRLVSLVVDLFGTDAFDVAREFDVAAYIFYTSTAMDLSLFLHMPELDETILGEYRDLTEPVRLPGCVPIPGKELFDPLQDRTNDAYKLVLHNAKRFRLADGIMLNSFRELEPGAVKALLEDAPGSSNKPKPPIYPVGPLVNMKPRVKDTESSNVCLAWLDKQPRGSVLFVSFGSGGTHSPEQINEIALGLEMSGQRFLWVVRRPYDKKDDGATYFGRNEKPSFDFLPDGFLERTKGVGMVMHPWAPQAQILAHGSTAGFMTHCGWNSSLESVVNGVPVVAWPLYAEQKMNAIVLTQEMNVALRPKASENGVVKREEIAKVVKSIIEGEEGKKLRNRIEELKEAAAKTLSPDGASTRALYEAVTRWKNQLRN
ncbi:UDP-glucuronosyl/UDP-glucosyltransferase [Parasponia andersonii]|uniref:Glycosyltransferase n=1 Tax=Parasponia andersonii TaxID=3476 RepID=A0A2P5D1U8_PARAD|nr:UDP-glucuronosyl/UDP-glucosyltransferase [Parasponia andersonii]